MEHIVHRGCINIDALKSFSKIQINVGYNDNKELVIYHNDRHHSRVSLNQNELLLHLCKIELPMHLMINIKAFGITEAKQLARDIVKCISQYHNHAYELCSTNEYCIQELIDMKQCSINYTIPFQYKIGLICLNVSIGTYGHLQALDFILFDYDILDQEIIDRFKMRRHLKLYSWVNQDDKDIYQIDGIVYNA